MNKYILIHKLINTSIIMLFPIVAYYIIEHNNLRNGVYGIIFIILNIIEISLFISFIIIASKCEWGTRKQHAIVKAIISFLIYAVIIILTAVSIII